MWLDSRDPPWLFTALHAGPLLFIGVQGNAWVICADVCVGWRAYVRFKWSTAIVTGIAIQTYV